jgi:hypothetical protein
MAPTSRRSTTTFRPAPTRRVQRNVDSDHDDSVVLDPASSDDGSDNDDDNCVRVNNNDLNNVNIVVVDHNGCAADAAGSYTKVLNIWMKNKDANSIIGSSSAPFANQMANTYGSATNFRTIVHPSLPNYVAATSGGTQGITDDAAPALGRAREPIGWRRLTCTTP